jgi:hypothetical protein
MHTLRPHADQSAFNKIKEYAIYKTIYLSELLNNYHSGHLSKLESFEQTKTYNTFYQNLRVAALFLQRIVGDLTDNAIPRHFKNRYDTAPIIAARFIHNKLVFQCNNVMDRSQKILLERYINFEALNKKLATIITLSKQDAEIEYDALYEGAMLIYEAAQNYLTPGVCQSLPPLPEPKPVVMAAPATFFKPSKPPLIPDFLLKSDTGRLIFSKTALEKAFTEIQNKTGNEALEARLGLMKDLQVPVLALTIYLSHDGGSVNDNLEPLPEWSKGLLKAKFVYPGTALSAMPGLVFTVENQAHQAQLKLINQYFQMDILNAYIFISYGNAFEAVCKTLRTLYLETYLINAHLQSHRDEIQKQLDARLGTPNTMTSTNHTRI